MAPLPIRSIGVVRVLDAADDIAIQARLDPERRAVLHVDAAWRGCLDGLAGFDFAWTVTFLHHADEPARFDHDAQRPVPLLLTGTGRGIGAFASRHPDRPNRLGLSLVQIVEVTADSVVFAGVDVVDGTPVVDLKPWVGPFDVPEPFRRGEAVRTGWYDDLPPPGGTAVGDPRSLALELDAAGEPGALVRVLALRGFGPAEVGDRMVVGGGRSAGSLLGRALTGPATDAARLLLGSTRAALTTGVSVDGPTATRHGLTCGGTAELLVQRLDTLPAAYWADDSTVPHASLTVVDGPVAGTTVTVDQLGAVDGHLDPCWHDDAVALALGEMRWGHGGLSVIDASGQRLAIEVAWARPRLVTVGAGPLADALAAAAVPLGWQHVGLDDTAQAVAHLESCSEADMVVVLSHDPVVDTPVLRAALRSPASYVGAVGSRRTQAARRARLLDAGVTDRDLDRLRGPAGLDLGAAGPAEIAISILAEVITVRSAREAAPLSRVTTQIHPGPSRRAVPTKEEP